MNHSSHKTALITGASRGIGKALSTAFAAEGYDLIMVCRSRSDLLEKLSAELSARYNVSCVCHTGDLSDESFVDLIFDSVDRLDVLVNNAGISHIGLMQDMTSALWHQVIDTNLTSAFYTSRKAIPLMLKQAGGSILNISSMWGSVGASMEVAYSASKGGMNAMTRALAKELAPSGIAVNAIACGVVDTEMNAHLTEEERDALKAEIPADRFAAPEEIANAALALIKAGPYLTGQVVGVDGGYI